MHKALQELLSELPPHLTDKIDELINAATSVFAFERMDAYRKGVEFSKEMFLWATQ